MQHYIVNITDARVVLFNGSLQLAPAGRRGYVKPLPRNAEQHREVKTLKALGRVRLLSAAEYRKFVSKGRVVPSSAKPTVRKVVVVEEVAEDVVLDVIEEKVEEAADAVVEDIVEDIAEDIVEDIAEEADSIVADEDLIEEDEPETSEVFDDEDSDSGSDAYITVEAFQELKASEQKDYLTELGVEGDLSNETKRVAAYEEFLSA